MTEPIRKALSLPDGEISYLEWETSGPPLHFAHANGFNGETYRALLQPLADRFHIFAWDARGHGFTSLPADPARGAQWTAYRDDLLQFLERVCGELAILAGHSMGGTVSVMAAALRPACARAVVLAEPVLIPRRAWLARFWNGNPEPNLADRAAQRRDTFPSFDAALAAYRGRGAFKAWPDEMLAGYLKGGLRIDAATGEARLACAPAWEAASFRGTPFGVAHLARKIACPLTVIYGTVNSTCRDLGAATLSLEHAGTRIIKIEGASHFLPMEQPDIVRAEIARTLSSLTMTGLDPVIH